MATRESLKVVPTPYFHNGRLTSEREASEDRRAATTTPLGVAKPGQYGTASRASKQTPTPATFTRRTDSASLSQSTHVCSPATPALRPGPCRCRCHHPAQWNSNNGAIRPKNAKQKTRVRRSFGDQISRFGYVAPVTQDHRVWTSTVGGHRACAPHRGES